MQPITVELENIGGLRQARFELQPGLNVVRAPNSSGKTSLIRSITSMFRDDIDPNQILRLDAPVGSIKMTYQGRLYERRFRRVKGRISVSGSILPFADPRATDVSVAIPEAGIVHDLTGGKADFSDYLESLSLAKYYDRIILVANQLVEEKALLLSGPDFERLDELSSLGSEYADLSLKREKLASKIEELQHTLEGDTVDLQLHTARAELQVMENSLAILREQYSTEENSSRRLNELLQWTVLTTLRENIEEGLKNSRDRQDGIRMKMRDLEKNIADQRLKIASIEKQIGRRVELEQEAADMKNELKAVQEVLQLKRERMEELRKFPLDHPLFPGRAVEDARHQVQAEIEWLRWLVAHCQRNYEYQMNSARKKFNENVAKVFQDLDLEGFKSVFLDQNNVVHVIRDNDVHQPLETLSASEKLTLGIVLMLSARQAYLPSFPFFLIDEVALHYDPDRCRQAIKYLIQNVPYVVITALTERGRAIRVEHTI